MVNHCRPATAPPFAFASRVSSATRTPNIFPGSPLRTAWTFTVKAPGLGTAAFKRTALRHLRALQIGANRERTGVGLLDIGDGNFEIELRDVAQDQAPGICALRHA